MTANPRTFAFSTLEERGDMWLLVVRDRMTLLDLVLADLTLEHKIVSVIGKIGDSQCNKH